MLSSLKIIESPKHVSYAVFSCLLTFLISSVFSTNGLAQNDSIRFDIPSQNVQSALDAFVEVTNFSLIYRKENISDAITMTVSGQYTPGQALSIMLQGTGLTFEFTSKDTVAIIKNQHKPAESAGESEAPAPMTKQKETTPKNWE